jgi:DNA-binding XRE family transcriptional regulator
MKNPDKLTIKSTRLLFGYTQKEASSLIYSCERTWRQWEAGERKMHPAFFELFNKKAK